MRDVIKPDYGGGSIVNLVSSLMQGLGGPTPPYPQLRVLPAAEIAKARSIVLLLIDGLRYSDVLSRARNGALHRNLRGRLTSVFPSTTATAVTSLFTATAPQQHAITGWFIYLREIGAVTAILPFQTRCGRAPLAASGIAADAFLGAPPLFARIAADGHFLITRPLVDSPFSRASTRGARRLGYEGLEDCFAQIARIARDGRQRRRFLYTYWPRLDALSHLHGCDSKEVGDHLHQIDRAFERLLWQLRGSGTLVLVVADHGFIDTRPADTVCVGHHPELAECLALPLCGEPRAAYAYVRPSRARDFERYVAEQLADRCDLHRSEDLVRQEWFGRGVAAPRLYERIGDYTLMMRGDSVIHDRRMAEKPFHMVGVHGGVSAREMYVPLAAAWT